MSFNQIINKEKDSKNIIMWYPFKENSNILEIGANNLEITKLLLNKANWLTSIVFTDTIKQEYFDKLECENLEIISKKINEIKLSKKYDYIVLIDIVKYLKIILPDSNNHVFDILAFCKNNLSENGKILLATDNRFGIKNFSGNYNENEEYIFQILEEKNENYKLYTKTELINIINELEFDYKFYYPYPNLENTNVIFSENYLPKGNNSKINYNVVYDSKSKVILDEVNLIKQFAKNNIVDLFSNSFFIEIFRKGINNKENDIEYVGFNNLRKENLKTLLTIKHNYAFKKAYNEESIKHIKKLVENSKRLNALGLNVLEEINDDVSVKTKYITNEKLLDNILCENLEKNNSNKFFEIINLWIEKCLKKLEKDDTKEKILDLEIDKELAKELNFLKDGFIDLVFENIFYQNDEFIIYDQEWKVENIPLEFIIYRAITNLYIHNNYLNKILKYDEVIKYYKLEKYSDIFNQVEEHIQKNIVDDKARIKYIESNNMKINLEEVYQKSEKYSELISNIENIEKQNQSIKNENKNLKNRVIDLKNENENLKNKEIDLKNENTKLENDIKKLNENLKILQEYQNYVESSRGWKLIKKINKFLKK